MHGGNIQDDLVLHDGRGKTWVYAGKMHSRFLCKTTCPVVLRYVECHGWVALNLEVKRRIAVLVFGLFHGLGLATKLQEFTISDNGLVTNIISFNVGVEIGQILALSTVFILLSLWRTNSSYLRHAFLTNTALMSGGFLLAGYQLSAYFLLPPI